MRPSSKTHLKRRLKLRRRYQRLAALTDHRYVFQLPDYLTRVSGLKRITRRLP